jgi:predicted ester cyclase
MTQRPRAFTTTLLLAVIPAFQGCSGPPAQDAAVEQNMAMVRAYIDAANRGDESYLDDYFGPGYVYHGPGGELDAEGFKAFHHAFLAGFPGVTLSADDIVASGEEVATRWTAHGVHSGEFQGIAPTGKEVTLTGIIISRFENGRVVEEWEEADILGLMRQLGVIPTPEGGEG